MSGRLKPFGVFFRSTTTPQDWRVAVREETTAAVKSVAAANGPHGDGRSMGDGAGGGGLQGVSSCSNNALGEGDPGGSGGGARDKVRRNKNRTTSSCIGA